MPYRAAKGTAIDTFDSRSVTRGSAVHFIPGRCADREGRDGAGPDRRRTRQNNLGQKDGEQADSEKATDRTRMKHGLTEANREKGNQEQKSERR
jgi:hypothetical protein